MKWSYSIPAEAAARCWNCHVFFAKDVGSCPRCGSLAWIAVEKLDAAHEQDMRAIHQVNVDLIGEQRKHAGLVERLVLRCIELESTNRALSERLGISYPSEMPRA